MRRRACFIFKIMTMKAEDIEFAVNITAQMDWGLKREDFEFVMELEPQGCFVLFDDSKRIGIATTLSFGKVGWFGNLVVSETHRKEGAGSLLVQHSIKYLTDKKNVETVGLYAYTHLVSFYGRLGFERDFDFIVLKGRGFSSPVENHIKEVERQDVEEIIEYDRLCFGASRKKLLEPILLDSGNLCYLSKQRERILGYAIAKVYDGKAELGPLICQHGANDVAINLLKVILNKLEGFGISMYVPKKESTIINVLIKNGFRESFQVARMFLGPPIMGDCIYLAESLERG